jgi:hypothetical protein
MFVGHQVRQICTRWLGFENVRGGKPTLNEKQATLFFIDGDFVLIAGDREPDPAIPNRKWFSSAVSNTLRQFRMSDLSSLVLFEAWCFSFG